MQITSRDICNSFDPLPKFNILGFQSLFTRAPPQDYITKEQTIKISILKNAIKIIVLILGYTLYCLASMVKESCNPLAEEVLTSSTTCLIIACNNQYIGQNMNFTNHCGF